MGAVDIAVLGLYFATLITLGYIVSRRRQDTEDFFLGKRQMPWLAVMVSILATETSALTFIGVPADAYRANYAYLQFAFGSLLGRILIAGLFLPAFYAGGVTTVYEYLYQRFGESTRGVATAFFFVTRLLASGVRLLAASIAVSVVTGWGLVPCIILSALIAMLYTTAGGIRAVIWTDVIQAFVFLGGALLALVYLLAHIPGGWQGVLEVAQPLGKMKVFEWDWHPSNARSLLVGVVNGCFMTFAALGTDQDLTQRMLTCKDVRSSQKSLILTGLVDFPIVLLFLTIGTLLFVFYRHFPDPNLPSQTDHIFPFFVISQLPPGLRGLLIAGVLAAAMSSLDSALGALSSSAIVDIYRPYIHPGASDRHYLRVSRFSVVIFAAFLVAVAIACRNSKEILWLGFKIGAFTYGGLLGIFLLGVLTRRGTHRGNVMAMLSSVAIVILLYLFESRTGLSWPWFVVIGTIWTFVMGFIVGRSPAGQVLERKPPKGSKPLGA